MLIIVGMISGLYLECGDYLRVATEIRYQLVLLNNATISTETYNAMVLGFQKCK